MSSPWLISIWRKSMKEKKRLVEVFKTMLDVAYQMGVCDGLKEAQRIHNKVDDE